MRILFIHNYYRLRGGEDTIFEQEFAKLRELGHDVDAVIFNNDQFGKSVGGKLIAAFQTLNNRASAERVKEAIARFKPDVIHIHNLFYTASPAVINAAKACNVPVVMTLHNYRLVCASGLLMRPGEIPCERCLTKTVPLDGIRFGCFRDSQAQSAQLTAITSLHKLAHTWQRVDRFITLTDFARQKMLQSSLQLRPEQVVVKPNFVPDLGYTAPDQRGDFFLFVGRLSQEKGIDVLLEAAKQVALPIEIIGEGPLQAAVEAAAQQGHVYYRGSLPREQVIERMRQCRAIIVPSIWYEGLPTVILEAFATGTPVICSDQGNLNQIVEDGKTGLLFQTGDPQSLSKLLTDVYQTPNTSINWGRKGRLCFEKKYTSLVVMDQLVSLYKLIIEDKNIADL
ncbi:glycosyl transferase group 1 [Fibrella aestuarina BUZ 2]|uniref:Glycosyl transferase group 1 n=1 Tax=Fibrella aestuarina BUZ 2 TaxID=1166018 RepID=I0K3W4_9BACT|nr:glycosyltransferase family 4 protein [Fibrella aestuarina]CCG98817.1 glycosyl transferase group 1 [Fibrella aestuarina BUZ 2]